MATDDLNPFPELDDGLDPVVLDFPVLIEDSEPVTPYGICWEFDFDKGDIRLLPNGDSVVLTEENTLRQWCQHVLNTVRGESPIFSVDAGTGLENLIGHSLNDNYIVAQISQEIVLGLSQHDRIASVVVDGVFPVAHEAFAFVTVTTDDGDVIENLLSLG